MSGAGNAGAVDTLLAALARAKRERVDIAWQMGWSMFRKVVRLVAPVLVLSAVFPAVSCTEEETEAVYLSLGTSAAAGTLADTNGDDIPYSDDAYTDQLYQRVKDRVDQWRRTLAAS